MAEATSFAKINDTVLSTLDPPGKKYWLVIGLLLCFVAAMFLTVGYQVLVGIGIAGMNHPVGWGSYIVNFVFWVGIAHSGTLISAVLYLFKVRWRTAICRSSEAMTVIAVMTAGLFPLFHLGRIWVFWWLMPYPNAADLWPNFKSPLVWDVIAVTTYFTVSAMFFYLGMIPDLAAARDRATGWRKKFYTIISLGWQQRYEQWRHYARAYACFACLATPLVVSVHSVVSWDFAMSILPGWHTTIFAPYFVAGAIHSGLAMVITLLLPMRKLLKLESIITMTHLERMAQLNILMALIIGYAYGTEVFIAAYSINQFEWEFFLWRMFGDYAVHYWIMVACNCVIPLLFFFKKIRTNWVSLLVISLLINVGMWMERFVIIASTAHDFLPSSWGLYALTPAEWIIMVGAFAWFFMLFLLFAKHLPSVAISEIKELKLHEAHLDREHAG
jgi:molybdopterin-containing oxidoreductase family membrane subunit